MSSSEGLFACKQRSRVARALDPGCQLPAAREVEFSAFAAGHLRRASGLGQKLRIPQHAAEEILQECLVRLWQELPSVDPLRWEGWLWRAIHFRRLKHFRAARHATKRQQCLADAPEPTRESDRPDVGIYLAQCDRELRSRIEALAPVRREVVRLYLLEDLPLAEIAAHLGIPENTAKHHWRLGQLDMRAAWERDRARECSTLRLAVFFDEHKRGPCAR